MERNRVLEARVVQKGLERVGIEEDVVATSGSSTPGGALAAVPLQDRRHKGVEVVGLWRQAKAPVGLTVPVVVFSVEKLGELDHFFQGVRGNLAVSGKEVASVAEGNVVRVHRYSAHSTVVRYGLLGRRIHGVPQRQ